MERDKLKDCILAAIATFGENITVENILDIAEKILPEEKQSRIADIRRKYEDYQRSLS